MTNDGIGITETKSCFSYILDRAERDRRPVTITRRGRPVLQITPTAPPADANAQRAKSLKAIFALSRKVKPMTRDEIVRLVQEGRR